MQQHRSQPATSNTTLSSGGSGHQMRPMHTCVCYAPTSNINDLDPRLFQIRLLCAGATLAGPNLKFHAEASLAPTYPPYSLTHPYSTIWQRAAAGYRVARMFSPSAAGQGAYTAPDAAPPGGCCCDGGGRGWYRGGGSRTRRASLLRTRTTREWMAALTL